MTNPQTFHTLYLEKLESLLDMQNADIQSEQVNESVPWVGVFDTEPSQSLMLMVDLKTDSALTLAKLESQLQSLREKNYLTHFNGTDIVERSVTIVASGNAKFEDITANDTYRDIFLGAPLDVFGDRTFQWENPNRVGELYKEENNALAFREDVAGLRSSGVLEKRNENAGPAAAVQYKYNQTNSYFASVSFTSSVGLVLGSRLSQNQLQIIRRQIRGAHESGLRVRYWGVPYWPVSLRNHIWHILVREGVDSLSVDDLRGAIWSDWRRKPGW